ncbi:MAG: hypothetical protein JOZ29_14315 [Deltaproteobacteria bacterium]|nr:hypothetical protein [Deltaproteobacteria bacterium]MBV8453425.1 hypothetical protein [Deltaproteobacteria bacterium]
MRVKARPLERQWVGWQEGFAAVMKEGKTVHCKDEHAAGLRATGAELSSLTLGAAGCSPRFGRLPPMYFGMSVSAP